MGTFDALHIGHLELLEGCRYQAGPDGEVWVGVNRSEFVERYKGHLPYYSLDQRIALLQAIRTVDRVFVNVGDEDATVLIDCVRPDLLAIGDDWLDPNHDERRYFRQLGVTPEWMAERGLRVSYIERTTGASTSKFRAAITPQMATYYAEQDARRLE